MSTNSSREKTTYRSLSTRAFLLLVPLLAIAISSCSTTRYWALDGDYNHRDFDGELTEEEQEHRERYITGARTLETFSDNNLPEVFRLGQHGRIDPDGGELQVLRHPDREVGYALHYESPEPFQSVTVCWKLDTTSGHLILWALIDGFGMPTFFNNPRATGAHIHLESLGFNYYTGGGPPEDTESLGHSQDNTRGYVIQEIRVEGDEIVMLVNEREFARYPMDRPRLMSRFDIGANGGGAGAIDWISIR